MFLNVSATVAAHITTWQTTRLPLEPSPAPKNAPDVFDGNVSSQVDDATSDIVANVLLVIGSLAFIALASGIVLQALTKKSYTKSIAFGLLGVVICLGPGAVVKWVDGGFSGIFN